MRLKIALGAVAVVAMAISGCSPDLVKAPNTAARDPLAQSAYPEIVMLDGLEQAIVKEQPVVKPPSGDDTLSVRVPLRSVIDQPISIKWQMLFSTDDGEQVTENPVWHQENILPRTRIFIQQTALSSKATKWNLTIRAN